MVAGGGGCQGLAMDTAFNTAPVQGPRQRSRAKTKRGRRQFCGSKDSHKMSTRDFLQTHAARQRMELYCMAWPWSPSAIRRPRLQSRGRIWIALLGPSIREGIAGLGGSVEGALRAFDGQYMRALRALAGETGHKQEVDERDRTASELLPKSRCAEALGPSSLVRPLLQALAQDRHPHSAVARD